MSAMCIHEWVKLDKTLILVYYAGLHKSPCTLEGALMSTAVMSSELSLPYLFPVASCFCRGVSGLKK